MNIAVIGTRGLPATWGGVERHVEEIGARLVDRGHQVTVFTRPGYAANVGDRYRGMWLREVRTVRRKGVEALLHSLNAAAHAVGRPGYDVVHLHAVGPALVTPVARYLTRAGVVHTVHGLDADRDKWRGPERTLLNLGTWMSARVPHRTIVVSQDLQRHYLDTYGRTTDHIPNGVTPVADAEEVSVADRFGVQPGRYLLHVGRLVPEKASDVLLRAFAEVPGDDVRLVVAGGSSDTDDYVAEIFALAAHDPRVVMAGYVYGADLASLYRNARAFVLPSRLEGLPITLLEAASHGLPLVVSAIPPHLEVVGHERPGARLAEPGSVASLSEAMKRSLHDDDERRGAAALATEVLQRYDWDAATVATEAVYRAAIDARRRGRSVAAGGERCVGNLRSLLRARALRPRRLLWRTPTSVPPGAGPGRSARA